MQRFGNIGRDEVRGKSVVAALELVIATLLTESHRAKKPGTR
jgi:hypothetical protein